METCPDCHGAGRIPSRGWAREEHLQISRRLSICPTCEGLGEIADWVTDEPPSQPWCENSLGQSDQSRGT